VDYNHQGEGKEENPVGKRTFTRTEKKKKLPGTKRTSRLIGGISSKGWMDEPEQEGGGKPSHRRNRYRRVSSRKKKEGKEKN